MSKDEKKKQKELEKMEKEQKKKNELKMKNKQKGLKAHKVCLCVGVEKRRQNGGTNMMDYIDLKQGQVREGPEAKGNLIRVVGEMK